MRWLTVVLVIAVVATQARSQNQSDEPFRVEVRVPSGVLGQPIPFEITVANTSEELLIWDKLTLTYKGRRFVPGLGGELMTRQLGPGQSESLTRMLLLNDAISDITGQKTDLPYRLVFRQAGRHEIVATVDVWRAKQVSIEGHPGLTRPGRDRLYGPVGVSFTVEVVEPRDKVEAEWWRLVSANVHYADLLATGTFGLPAGQDPPLVDGVRRFVKRHPKHPLARELGVRLDRLLQAKKRAPNTQASH